MRHFPAEFSDLLSPRGLRILNGDRSQDAALFKGTPLISPTSRPEQTGAVDDCSRLMDQHLYPHLSTSNVRSRRNHHPDEKLI